jgi:glycyl-tRNA synthetase
MDMDKLVALCRRRGFIFQSSEIYGGLNGFWDYGPLGVELKRNIKEAWWHDMVQNPPPGPEGEEIHMVGVDCALIMNPKVWVASGHVHSFVDLMVDCKTCRKRFRADKVYFGALFGSAPQPDDSLPEAVLAVEADDPAEAQHLLQREIERLIRKKKLGEGRQLLVQTAGQAPASWRRTCPVPGCPGELTEPRQFNLLFETYIGALREEENKAYLRPETAQGIFVNFKNILDSMHLKLPFGVAQIGKAFRNEINPRNYTFRSREFEQMEIEFFCHPRESFKWYAYWRDVRLRWYAQLGIRSERLRPREQGPEERAFYSIGTTDIEYLFPFSSEPQELEGVAHRADYDLEQHMRHSGKDLYYFDEEGWAKLDKSAFAGDRRREQEEKQKFRFLPHVIEPSAGVDRFALAVLCEAYSEDLAPDEKGEPRPRTVLRFHPRLAPIKAAVLPLVNKEGMPERAYALYRELKAEWNVVYDDSGAIGRRYRRQDEIGTPWCITIDGQTLRDDTVTLRDRDTLQQQRLPLAAVAEELRRRLRPQSSH